MSEIKKECDSLYKIIKDAKNRLDEIRKSCTHENTFMGKYSWRVGCINDAKICSDCGEVISIPDFVFESTK
jgi:hypothetical protein